MAGQPSGAQVSDQELEEGELPEQAADDAPSVPKLPQDGAQPAQRVRAGKKARKRKENATQSAAAAGFVDVYGPQGAASVTVHPGEGPIRLSDAQNLLLWVLGEGTNPRWCFVKNKPLVKRVVLLALHGLDAELYQESKALLPSFGELLGEPIELQARNATLVPAQTVHSLFSVPQTKKRKREEAALVIVPDGAQQRAQQAEQATQGLDRAAATASPGARLEGKAGAAAESTPAADGVGTRLLEEAGHPNTAAAAGSDVAACPASAPGNAAGAEGAAGTPAPKRQRLRPGGDVATSGTSPAGPEAKEQRSAASHAALDQEEDPPGLQAPKFACPGRAPPQAPKFASLAAPPPVALRRVLRPFPPSHYVMTLEEMRQHGYPLPEVNEAGEMVCPEGFVATQPCGGAPKHDMVALDCEMCITEAGFELTRATVIDKTGQVLLDELVVPDRPITDYNTRYSGITEEMLSGVTTRLPDVQQKLLAVVSAETLLVTHSGENDLQALRVIHANMLDTSVMFPHPRGLPYKSALRVLASRHLLRTIQRESHDPVEDAKAAMDLALLKIERGPSYGAGSSESGDKLMEVLTQHGRRCTLVDSQAALNRLVAGNCSAVVAEGDEAVWQGVAKEAGKPGCDLVWGQPEPSALYQSPELAAQRAAVLRVWDSRLAQLWAGLEQGSLVVVIAGQGDTLYTRYLQEQKYRRQQGLDGMPAWTPACEEVLARANMQAVRGLCFAAVK
ncbi:hypothetical protein N2152v2_008848 [Parachlorella kessleri]